MNKDDLKEFLKDYATILKEGVDISNDLPLQSEAIMAGGAIKVMTRDGRRICHIAVEGDNVSPSMPIGPASTTYEKLIVELINKYHNKLNEQSN